MAHPFRRPAIGLLLTLAVLGTACTTNRNAAIKVDGKTPSLGLAARVASYDLNVAHPHRFLVGLVRADDERLVAYGHITLQFAFLGTKDKPRAHPTSELEADAAFVPIPGQHLDATATTPRYVTGAEAVGVYQADRVAFPRPGFWQVTTVANIDNHPQTTTGSFDVAATGTVPDIGDQAPRTDTPVVGQPGVDPKTIDSRADPGVAIPDPELHHATIPGALDAHRPFLVVASTPVFCQSRFCGPITDAASTLSGRYADHMDFIHLEIWKDFQAEALNPYITPWINPTGGSDGHEPWVFLVGTDGRIKARFDNVVSDRQLEDAVKATLGQ